MTKVKSANNYDPNTEDFRRLETRSLASHSSHYFSHPLPQHILCLTSSEITTSIFHYLTTPWGPFGTSSLRHLLHKCHHSFIIHQGSFTSFFAHFSFHGSNHSHVLVEALNSLVTSLPLRLTWQNFGTGWVKLSSFFVPTSEQLCMAGKKSIARLLDFYNKGIHHHI